MFLSVKVKNLCPRASLREVLVLESVRFRNFLPNAPWSNNLNETQEDIFEELLCDHRDVSFKNDVVKDNCKSLWSMAPWRDFTSCPRLTYQGNNRGSLFWTCEFISIVSSSTFRSGEVTPQQHVTQRTEKRSSHVPSVECRRSPPRVHVRNAERVRITPSTKSQTTLSAWQSSRGWGPHHP